MQTEFYCKYKMTYCITEKRLAKILKTLPDKGCRKV
jgi:hypothetical protein